MAAIVSGEGIGDGGGGVGSYRLATWEQAGELEQEQERDLGGMQFSNGICIATLRIGRPSDGCPTCS